MSHSFAIRTQVILVRYELSMVREFCEQMEHHLGKEFKALEKTYSEAEQEKDEHLAEVIADRNFELQHFCNLNGYYGLQMAHAVLERFLHYGL